MRSFHGIEASGSVATASAVGAAGVPLNDKFLNKQWYLDSSNLSPLNVNVASVWDDYTGKGIKVGVVDTQIDYRHTDLAKAYDTTLDYNFALATANVTIDPASLPHYHGTFVAGVISAEHNNAAGTAGLAAGATLVGLGVDYSSDKAVEQILKALNHAVNVDVVNNSWRFTSIFGDDFRKNPEYEAALVNLVSNGRGGLGTSIVFAAGNEGKMGSSNYNNFQNSPFTIAVGAVDSDGNPSSFTSIGANVLLSAGGRDIFSTTPSDKYNTASGTSFAAPQVTAAIALMYEANPLLGYRDVQQILAYSASREGLTANKLHGDGWQINGATNHNGGGLHFSDAFGYGFLNVHDAVRLAESWTEQQTFANMTEIAQRVLVNETLVAGSNDRISVNVVIDKAISIEHVQLKLDMVWRDSGDIDVYLISPDGTKVRLIYDLPYSDKIGSFRFFEFSSVASMGEMGAGTWTIEIVNNKPWAVDGSGAAMSGLLRELTLTVQGSTTGLNDDTYIYTDEFAALYTGDDLAARKVLRDTDGGKDTINAAAVTSNSIFDLTGNTATRIAGHVLDIGANSIENAFGGDGNDTFVGTSAANILKGGRGNDTFRFSGGNDLIDGQQGSDTLFVGADFAAVSGYVTTVGEVAMSTASGTISIIRNVELFVFSNITYSFDQIVSLLAGEPDGGGGGGTDPGNGTGGGGDTGGGNGDPGGDTGGDTGGGARTFENTFNGGTGADKHSGTNATDLIYGGKGNDNLLGRDGNDDIHGEDGDDSMNGGKGNDHIYGGAGKDQLLGNDGDDKLYGGDDKDMLFGHDGDDFLQGGRGADKLIGGRGADTFVFDLSEIDTLDLVVDFNADEGDQILVTGLTGSNNAASFNFVTRGRYTYLEVQTSLGVVEIAKIQGTGLDGLSLQTSEAGLLFA